MGSSSAETWAHLSPTTASRCDVPRVHSRLTSCSLLQESLTATNHQMAPRVRICFPPAASQANFQLGWGYWRDAGMPAALLGGRVALWRDHRADRPHSWLCRLRRSRRRRVRGHGAHGGIARLAGPAPTEFAEASQVVKIISGEIEPP